MCALVCAAYMHAHMYTWGGVAHILKVQRIHLSATWLLLFSDTMIQGLSDPI